MYEPDIPTVVRHSRGRLQVAMVITTLGQRRLTARFQVYVVGVHGRTSIVKDSFHSTERGAIEEFERWEEGR